MLEIEREMAERELGRLALAVIEGLHGTDVLTPIVGNEALFTLQKIQDILNNEHNSDFECVEEIVDALWHAGITTDRHDFG